MEAALPIGATRLLVADDHRPFTEALQALLASDSRLTVVGTAYDGEQAVELASALAPDVVLMDVAIPVLDSIEATRRICKEDPSARVLILTDSESEIDSARALEAGAAGIILRGRSVAELVDAILAVSTLLIAFAGPRGNATT
jgi:DNA-binding NarL/FixJ family response regulator